MYLIDPKETYKWPFFEKKGNSSEEETMDVFKDGDYQLLVGVRRVGWENAND